MTDEKRIEEIRARRGGYLYNEDSSLGYWASRDVAFLLAALDAERARAVRAEAERDARPAISPEDAANLLRWMLSERAESCVEHPTPHWVDRVVDATSAHAAKVRTSPARCEICDWPLHDTIDKGCTAESCSYRPDVGSEEHRRIAARRKEIAAKAGGGT